MLTVLRVSVPRWYVKVEAPSRLAQRFAEGELFAGLSSVTTYVTLISVAIKGFRHKGLHAFFVTGSTRGIQATHADRLRLLLGRLHASADPRDMNLPGLHLHELHGTRKGTWAVNVSGNWRLTFGFVGKDAERVDYEDYH